MTVLKVVLVSGMAALWAGAANAELSICNETQYKQGLSVGYYNGAEWVSEGWWNIGTGQCATVIQGDLKQRYYYYRAEVNGGPFTGTNHLFCTSTSEYTIYGDSDCRARGYDQEDFREFDTGTSATSFTLTLVPG